MSLLLQARMLSLLAAKQNWRLALLRLGHLHHLGDHDVPADPALAYGYYSNIASQTTSDIQNPSAQQVRAGMEGPGWWLVEAHQTWTTY